MQRGFLAFVAGPVHAVDEQNILPAVVVVIEKSAAGAKSFREEFASECAAVVLKLKASRGGHIGEAETEGLRACSQKITLRECGGECEAASGSNEFAALHGRLTKPLRMA